MDYRETISIRGFHLLAATKAAERALRSFRLWHLGGRRPEERLAVRALEYELDIKLRRCSKTLLPFMPHFDLYVAIVDRLPRDKLFQMAVRSARNSLIGTTFDLADVPQDLSIVAGFDTAAFGFEVASRLHSMTSPQS